MGGESRPPGALAPRSECPAVGRVPVPGFPSTGQRAAPRRRRVSTHRPPVSTDWTHRLVAVRWLRRETVRRKHWDTLHVTVAVARPGPPGIVRRMYWNLTDQS